MINILHSCWLSHLYITVSRFGTTRFDTHSEKCLTIAYELESFENILAEGVVVEHKLVAWCDYHHSVGVAFGYQ